MSKKMSLSGCRLKCERAQQRECRKGGLIVFQPSQSETQCLSTSMTEQPFLRLDAFPLISRKTWNVKQSVVPSRSNRGSCGLHGLHGLPSFLVGAGFIVFLGFCGFVAQKVVDIRHPPWCRRPRRQGRAAFLQSATSCIWECPGVQTTPPSFLSQPFSCIPTSPRFSQITVFPYISTGSRHS